MKMTLLGVNQFSFGYLERMNPDLNFFEFLGDACPIVPLGSQHQFLLREHAHLSNGKYCNEGTCKPYQRVLHILADDFVLKSPLIILPSYLVNSHDFKLIIVILNNFSEFLKLG